jgi:hypothetical protein
MMTRLVRGLFTGGAGSFGGGIGGIADVLVSVMAPQG